MSTVKDVKSIRKAIASLGIKRILLLTLTLFMCFASGLASIYLSHQWEFERRQSLFNSLAEIYGDNLMDEIRTLETTLPIIAARIDGGVIPDRSRFKEIISEGNPFYERTKMFGLAVEVTNDLKEIAIDEIAKAGDYQLDAVQNFLSNNDKINFPIIYVDDIANENSQISDVIYALQGKDILDIFMIDDIEHLGNRNEVTLSSFIPSLTNLAADKTWYYMAMPVDVFLTPNSTSKTRAFIFFGMDVAALMEHALADLSEQELVLYLTSPSEVEGSIEKPMMRFEDGKVTALTIEEADNFLSEPELRHDEIVNLAHGIWLFSVVPEKDKFSLDWQQIAIGYLAAILLIMFAALAIYYTINWTYNLERIVAKRTRQLERTKVKAEAANKSKSEFLANMSHELRTPLNAVIGFADIMKSGMIADTDIDKYKEYSADISDSGSHLLNIINNILDLSKIEANKMNVIEEEVLLSELIRPTIGIMRNKIDEKEIEFIINEKSFDQMCLLVDIKIFKQILLNLFSNAVKFTDRCGKIVVSTDREKNGMASISIIDNGIGMEPSNIPLALKPFIQINTGLNRLYEGTGLGLPLVKSFVELHGGKFELSSELDVGTKAKIYLPGERLFAA